MSQNKKKVLENDGNLLVLVGCIIVNKAGLGYKYLSMSVVYYICNTTGEARFMFARNITVLAKRNVTSSVL